MIFKKSKYKNSLGYGIKVYRNPYPIDNPTKEFEAILFRFGKYGFWIFRNQTIKNDWPSTTG